MTSIFFSNNDAEQSANQALEALQQSVETMKIAHAEEIQKLYARIEELEAQVATQKTNPTPEPSPEAKPEPTPEPTPAPTPAPAPETQPAQQWTMPLSSRPSQPWSRSSRRRMLSLRPW